MSDDIKILIIDEIKAQLEDIGVLVRRHCNQSDCMDFDIGNCRDLSMKITTIECSARKLLERLAILIETIEAKNE